MRRVVDGDGTADVRSNIGGHSLAGSRELAGVESLFLGSKRDAAAFGTSEIKAGRDQNSESMIYRRSPGRLRVSLFPLLWGDPHQLDNVLEACVSRAGSSGLERLVVLAADTIYIPASSVRMWLTIKQIYEKLFLADDDRYVTD